MCVNEREPKKDGMTHRERERVNESIKDIG